jgi:RNA polymerase sigma factor (TIGR02999 family)
VNEITQILSAIDQGNPQVACQLLPLVYDELRQLAAHKLTQEKAGQTLEATALVHEAYLRLVGDGEEPQWESRGHFFAAAAEAMRRILVERARRKATHKHGGQHQRLDLDEVSPASDERSEQLLALDEALAELEGNDAQAARLVKLRYFAGLSHQEAAQALGISRGVADRLWVLARAWLYQRIGEQ